MRRAPTRATGGPASNGMPDACASRCRNVEPGGPAGSSRSTSPSSAATSIATADASFVTDAHAKRRSASPCIASIAPVTPTATCSHGQRSTWRNASTNGETSVMERRLISSGAAFEARVGYSRAVRVGDRVWVSGTAPIMPGDADPPSGAYEQARVCLGIIERALTEAGARMDDVVRTHIYVTEASLIDEVGRAHGETFGRVRPATTGIVAQLLDPRWLVEIEADAGVLRPGSGPHRARSRATE